MINIFSRPMVRNLRQKKHNQRNHIHNPKPYVRRYDNIQRARNKSRLDILGSHPTVPKSGCKPAFITCTLDAEHEPQKQDIKWFLAQAYKFVRRVRAINKEFKFKWSIEWQDGKRLTPLDILKGKKPRMALHLHGYSPNFPYLVGDYNAALRKLWPVGNCHVVPVGTSNQDRIKVAHYLTKYVTKDAVTANMKYQKMIWTTENFVETETTRNPKNNDYLIYKWIQGQYYIAYYGSVKPLYRPTTQDLKNMAKGWEPIMAQKTNSFAYTPIIQSPQ